MVGRRKLFSSTLCCVHLVVAAALYPASVAADQARPSMTGVVTNSSGEPLAGVRVDISTAAPKIGRGVFCPSCYLDCRKWAKTDELGRFTIDKLDSSLKFRLIVAYSGFQTNQTKLVDPSSGAVDIELKSLPDDIDPSRMIKGLVRSEAGTPIPGAMVAPYGAKTENRRWWGKVDGVAPTVTDDQGRFTLIAPDNFLAVDIEITADGHCGKLVYEMVPGKDAEPIIVPVGASVSGKVVRNGQPVADMSVAVVQLERSVSRNRGVFIAAVGAVTQSDGSFEISNLPPDQRYCVYSVVGEAKRTESPYILPVRTFGVPGSDKTRDLGSLEVATPIEIRGRVKSADDQPLPKRLKVAFDRDPAWDLVSFPVAPDGTFVASGLPPETYRIRIANRKLVIAANVAKYQVLGGNSVGVNATESISDLVIPVRNKTESRRQRPKISAVSIEAKHQSKPGVTLTGRVMARGNPVPGLTLKLFRAPPSEPGQRGDRFESAGEVETDQDGRYSFDGLKKGEKYYFQTISTETREVREWPHQEPYIQTVRATEGHAVKLPDAVLISSDQTLSGVVVDPDGNPVSGLSVTANLASGRSLSRPANGPPPWTETDEEGAFAITNLPEHPIQLMAYMRNSAGGTVKYPVRVEPKLNSKDIRIIFDPTLGTEIEDLD